MKNTNIKEWLTVQQAAAKLKIQPVTVYSYISKNYISAIRLGNQWLIHESEIIRRGGTA